MSLLAINTEMVPKWGHRRPVPKLPNDIIIKILIERRDIKREINRKFILNRVPRPEFQQKFIWNLIAINQGGNFTYARLEDMSITPEHYEKYETILPLLHDFYSPDAISELPKMGSWLNVLVGGEFKNAPKITSKFRSWHSRLPEEKINNGTYAFPE